MEFKNINITRTNILDIDCIARQLRDHNHRIADITDFPISAGNNGKILAVINNVPTWIFNPGLPSFTGNAGKYLTTDGNEAIWQFIPVQQQADWDEVDNLTLSFIKNKPYIPQNTSDLVNDSGYVQNTLTLTINGISYSLAFDRTWNLTTTDIPEGNNLYYTDGRVRAALSLTTSGNNGSATYNSGTGAFNIPTYTLVGLGGVPLTRTITINGITYDLDANRTWTLTTSDIAEGSNLYYTDARVLSYGNTQWVQLDGAYSNPIWITDLAWSKLTGTPTSLLGYGILDAYTKGEVDTLLTGYLLIANFNSTFDARLALKTTSDLAEGSNLYFTTSRARTSLSFSAGSGAYNSTTGVITIPTDNNQIANSAGYITTINGIAAGGELSGTYPNPTLVNSAVIGKVLTGLNVTGGTVLSTDSILTAFGKVQNQINSLLGGDMWQGVWNATTNTPTITSSVGTKGHYYVVNVAGSTNIDGITDWKIGDWIIFNGTTWNKVDNTDAVSSVNGFIGAVSLTTANIPEVTNLYYTDLRARAALSSSATGLTYNSTTGVFTITSGYVIPTTTQETNWNLAYTQTRQWDGGATGLVAATGRTSLGLGTMAVQNTTNYYTAGEINGFFSGANSIGGYNKTFWDIAYSWNNHAGLYYTLGSTVANSTLLQGYSAVVASTANTVALRDGSGYLRAVFFYDDNASISGSGVTSIYGGTGDRYMYKFNASAVQTFLGLGSAAYINAATSAVPSTIVQRDSSGDAFFRYINTSQAEESGTVTGIITRQGDNYMRVSPASTVRNYLSLGDSDVTYMRYQGFTLDANTMLENRTGFTYASNAPYTGPIVHFNASGYGLQLNATYSGGGELLAYRTRNGDTATWNGWNNIWHEGNFTPGNYVPYTGATAHLNLGAWNLTATSVIATTSFLSDNYYRASGTPMMAGTSNYTILYTQAGAGSLYLGGAGDPANYYDNTTHHFRNISGGSTYATFQNGMSTFYGETQALNIDNTNRTTYRDILYVTAQNGANPFDGHGGGILFRGATYHTSSNVPYARIGTIINSNSTYTYGSTMFFDIATNSSGSTARAFELYWTGRTKWFYNAEINGSDRVLELKGASVNANSLIRFSDSTTAKFSTGFNNGDYIIYDDVAGAYRFVVTSTGIARVYSGTNFEVQGGASKLIYTSPGLSYTQATLEVYSSGSYGPRISMHYGGVVASQISVESSGRVAIINNPGTSYEAFVAGAITSTSDFVASTHGTFGGRTRVGGGYITDLGGTGNHSGIAFGASGTYPVDGNASYSSTKDLGYDSLPWRSAYLSGAIRRTNPLGGYLNGGYAGIETTTTPGLIYALSDSYLPTSSALAAMYGVGYTNSAFAGNPRGASGWGFYVASGGGMNHWLGDDAYRSNVPIVNTSASASNFSGALVANGLYTNGGYNVVLAAGDIYFNNNSGYGILSQNGNRAIAITNTAISLNYHTTVSASGSADYILKTIAPAGAGTNYIFLAGKTGVTNGFTVVYNGSSMVYDMAAGSLSVGGGGSFAGILTLNDLLTINTPTSSFIQYKVSGTTHGYSGVAYTTNSLVTGSVLGDMVHRTVSKDFLVSTNDGASVAFRLAATSGAATFSSSVTASSVITNGGNVAVKLIPSALSTYGSANYAQWFRADGSTNRAYVGYGSGNDQNFQIATTEVGGTVQVYSGNGILALTIASNQAATFSNTVTINSTLYLVSSILNSNSTYLDIYNNTSDGSDTKITRIGAGGDVSTSRGAFIDLRGNEAASPGSIFLNAGASGTISANANIGGTSLSMSSSVTAAEVYSYGWFRNYTSNTGLFNTANSTHFSSSANYQWDLAGSLGTYLQLALRVGGHGSTVRGYLYADSSNNIGLLAYDGNWALRTNSSKSAIVYGGISDGSYHRFTNPQGATYVSGASSATGAIKIRMPNPGSAPMMMATINVYEYTTGKSFTLKVAGHTSGGLWYNTSAYWGSDIDDRNITVRFGTEGGYYCIWIGETGTSWSYPQVWLTDVQIGYSSIAESWANDWLITFETALGSISQTKTVYGASTTGGAYTPVRRDSSGYIFNSYFNTSSGGAERNASGMGYFAGFNSSDYYIRSYTPTAARIAMGLATTDNVTFNQVTATNGGFDSDLTLKTVILRGQNDKNIADSVEMIKFIWKDTNKGIGDRYGYGAQDLLELIPEAVYKTGGGTYAVDYTQVHTVLIDENTRRIQALEARVKELESQLNIN